MMQWFSKEQVSCSRANRKPRVQGTVLGVQPTRGSWGPAETLPTAHPGEPSQAEHQHPRVLWSFCSDFGLSCVGWKQQLEPLGILSASEVSCWTNQGSASSKWDTDLYCRTAPKVDNANTDTGECTSGTNPPCWEAEVPHLSPH